MAKNKHKDPTWQHQNPGVLLPQQVPDTNTTEKQELDLKSYLMMLVKGFKKDLNNSLKEIQENMGQQVKALREETQKSLKEIQTSWVNRQKPLKRKHKNPLKNYRKTQSSEGTEQNYPGSKNESRNNKEIIK